MYVVGQEGDSEAGSSGETPTCEIGRYRARDGSGGAAVGVDLDRPHVVLVVGKRGTGKSYTLGVLAEGLARASGVRPVIADPMGVFGGLDEVVAAREEPTVSADALGPRAWCEMLDLAPASGAGSLLWRAASECETLAAMREFVTDATVDAGTRRTVLNHLDVAAAWNVFDGGGTTAGTGGRGRTGGTGAVLDLSGREREAMNAVCAGVATRLYRVAQRATRGSDGAAGGSDAPALPWLLVDEAHAFFEGVAGPPLRRLLTRGRQPGVSLVAATQRPGALPEVAISQADLLVVHRLTSRADREALAAARPSYMAASLDERMPTDTGEALLVDDATESVHAVQVRERETPHGGASPRASERTETVE